MQQERFGFTKAPTPKQIRKCVSICPCISNVIDEWRVSNAKETDQEKIPEGADSFIHERPSIDSSDTAMCGFQSSVLVWLFVTRNIFSVR